LEDLDIDRKIILEFYIIEPKRCTEKVHLVGSII
jgi:hypothetical protein